MCAQLLKESSKIVMALQAELKIIRNVEMYLCYYKEVLAEMKKARVYTAAECFSRRGMINSPRLQYFTTLLHVFVKCNSARIDIFKICIYLLSCYYKKWFGARLRGFLGTNFNCDVRI
jgi:hypothetical protein